MFITLKKEHRLRLSSLSKEPWRTLGLSNFLPVAGLSMLVLAVFFAPGFPFIVDGGVYLKMAQSFVESHSLSIGGNGGIDGAPALVNPLTVAHDGRVMPQYPSGYAILAAPFYALFGVHGLMLMNALSFALCIWLSHILAKQFYDETTARWTAALVAVATFLPTYAFGVWPHLVALVFWLAAVAFAVAASRAEGRTRTYRLLALSGLMIGAGVNIRIDLFLVALVIFFWLRLFAMPRDRLAPLTLFLGMTPGFLLAAWLNSLKFGVFMPFSYGYASGLDSADHYIRLAAAGTALIAVAWAVNIHSLSLLVYGSRFRLHGAALAASAAAVLLAISPLRDFVGNIFHGLYVLVIDLQAHDAYYQAGVEKNEYGQLLFWGYPKKALIQSIPWAPLAILPVLGAVRGRHVMAVCLCILAIAAPLCFYAMNQWHGGGSYNMRYFIPALPFIALLSAYAFSTLARSGKPKRQTSLILIVVACALYLGFQELGHSVERLYAPMALYPQWLIAIALSGGLLWSLLRPSAKTSLIAAYLSVFAFGYAAAINIYEEIGHERTRAEQLALARDVSAAIPAGSLVVTPMPILLLPAEDRGVSVMAPYPSQGKTAAQAAEAFANSGRCVFFHNILAADHVRDHLYRSLDSKPLWAPSNRFRHDPRLAFFTFADALGHCRF